MKYTEKTLSVSLARQIIMAGDEGPDKPCHRIEFKGLVFDENSEKEYGYGGFSEPALARFIEDTLIKLEAMSKWLPIEAAPRDSSRVLIARRANFANDGKVCEAWWRMPYEDAREEQCWWCYDGNGVMLDESMHGVGASHWMHLPELPES